MSWNEAKDAILGFLATSSYLWLVYEMRKLSRLVISHEEKHIAIKEELKDFKSRVRSLEMGRHHR